MIASVFFSCPVDESSLFRCAKRRSAYDEIIKMIEEDTEINLRTAKWMLSRESFAESHIRDLRTRLRGGPSMMKTLFLSYFSA